MPVFLARKKNININHLKRKSIVAQAILVLLGIELLFIAGFTALSLPTATAHNLQIYFTKAASKLYTTLPRRLKAELETQAPSIVPPLPNTLPLVRYSLYVPQAPVAIFLGYILGWTMALTATVLYLIFGLIGPFFNVYPLAAGSGINYYLQPGFGYLIGMIFAAVAVGWLSRNERKSTNQLLCLLVGLLCVHGIGLAYMLGVCLFAVVHEGVGGQLTWSNWLFEEIRNLSWYALPYDLIFSLAAIGIGFPFRWLVEALTAPDIGSTKGTVGEEKLVEFRSSAK